MSVSFCATNFSFCALILYYLLCFYLELNKSPVEGFSAGLIDDSDIYRWEVLVIGPPDTYLYVSFIHFHCLIVLLSQTEKKTWNRRKGVECNW